LLVAVQPSHIQMAIGQELTQDQRREARASLLRGKLGEAFGPRRKPPRLIRPDTPEPPAGPGNTPSNGGDR
jgi:hypothetical protein